MPAPDGIQVLDALLDLQQMYAQAEIEMLQMVARRLKRGIKTKGWAEQKLAETQALNKELSRVISELNASSVQQLNALIGDAHRSGISSAQDILKRGNVGPIGGAFTKVSPSAINALYAQTVSQVTGANLRILRSTLDGYRSIVSQASGLGVAGVLTRDQVSQRMLDGWAKSGLTGFTDKAGRRWDMGSYAEMSSRSAITRSFVQGRLDKFAQYTDLVRIDYSPEVCPFCQPFEGRIFSQSGKDPQFPALSVAIAGGMFHPNCTHAVSPYFPGLKDVWQDRPDPSFLEHEAQQETYLQRQEQRSLERNIRDWKRRQAVATPGSMQERLAQAKVREWQAKQRAFIERTGRTRLYARESITGTGRRTAIPKAPPVPKPTPVAAPPKIDPRTTAKWREPVPQGVRSWNDEARNARDSWGASWSNRNGSYYDDPLYTENQRYAIDRYSRSGYESINSQLRDGLDYGAGDEITQLKEAMQVTKIPEDIIVRRGVGYEAFGMDMSDASLESLLGQTISDPAFLSTTIGEPFTGDVLMEIYVPKGTPAIWIGDQGEHEVLLGAGSKLRIDSVEEMVHGTHKWKVLATLVPG